MERWRRKSSTPTMLGTKHDHETEPPRNMTRAPMANDTAAKGVSESRSVIPKAPLQSDTHSSFWTFYFLGTRKVWLPLARKGSAPVRTVAWIDAFRGAVRTSGGQGLHLPPESHAGTLMRSALVGRASLCIHPFFVAPSHSSFAIFQVMRVRRYPFHSLQVKPSVGI